jgi:hypothetical protein
MSKLKGEPKIEKPKDEPIGFSKTVKFIQPFEGSITFNNRAYSFKITSRQIWPQGKRGMKTPVEVEITNEGVYDWLKKFEAVSA